MFFLLILGQCIFLLVADVLFSLCNCTVLAMDIFDLMMFCCLLLHSSILRNFCMLSYFAFFVQSSRCDILRV